MADASVDLQASNLFSLHANFKTQTSGTSNTSTNITTTDEKGNVACEKDVFDIINYTQSARYCGSNFMTDIGTFLTKFGDVQGSKIVTGLTINMTANDYVTIDITGHNHVANAHAAGLSIGYADVSDFLPHEPGEAFAAWDGFGVPEFGLGSDGEGATSATVTFSMTHVDQIAQDGSHLVGKNITPRAELSMSVVGDSSALSASAVQSSLLANTNTMGGVLVDSFDVNDSNSVFDTWAFTAHSHFDLAVA